MGIRQRFTGQGLGTRLFQSMEQWRANSPLTRLELTVMANNERGLALYKKAGFEVEGRKKNALLIRGTYVDEICMGKLYV
ncbi:GNAT family protein [Paenibacillus agilis]|uniref:GNAT family N-acetyltransferase n=1 Tax=Paenibacillus agilis TaxID=3020863 RepID=UPI0030052C46